MAYELLEIGKQLAALRPLIIEFGEIAPYGLASGIGRIGCERRPDLALGVAGEPVGVVGDQLAVLRGVVDDEIHDHPQSIGASRLGKSAQ